MPDTYNLDIYRGDTYVWNFFLWADPDKTIPIDLTDVEVKAEIRDRPSGPTIVPLLCTKPGPEVNRVRTELTATNSKLVPQRGQWDLQLTYVDGKVRTFVAGVVRNTLDITDSTT